MVKQALNRNYIVSSSRKGAVLLAAFLLAVAFPVLAEDIFTDVPRADANMTTGPEVGERIPMFAATDQHGVRRSFADIKGPNGAMILFHRSADW